MSSNVLADRDTNTHLKPANGDKEQPKSMEYHRQMLQSRMKDDSAQNTYVSPSDNIMSPCTAKLSAMKSKHFMKAKPQSLFAAKKAATSMPLGNANMVLGKDVLGPNSLRDGQVQQPTLQANSANDSTR